MRISLSMLFGLLVALGVFLVVQSFVVQSQFRRITNEQYQDSGLVNFSNGTQGVQLQANRQPKKPTAFNEPPLPPVVSLAAVKPPSIAAPGMAIPQVDLPFGVSAGGTPAEQLAGTSEPAPAAAPAQAAQKPILRAGNLVLIGRVEPEYPKRALRDRLEGSVTVKFTVEPDGSVSAPTVIKAKPRRGIFDDAALRAVLKWKFKPIPKATETSVTLVFNLNLG
ncbi:MAG TPA: TonB family protein [Gammaproteobacteria bacterium]|nr:TonB family protein [Gammaproteobacteria bacterium]